MAEFENAFRSSFGLDAGGEKVTNVALADKDTLTDGVNVGFFNEHNSIQQYDENRGYETGFSVIYDGKMWYAAVDIAKPAGAFEQSKWIPLNTAPIWDLLTATEYDLKPGTYNEIDTSTLTILMKLPQNAKNGDMVVIKDNGGNVGVNFAKVVAQGKHQLKFGKNLVKEFTFTYPYAQVLFVYRNDVWVLSTTTSPRTNRTISAQGDTRQQIQAGEEIMRRTSTGTLHMQLPRYANQGDAIYTYDMDGMNAINHTLIYVHPDSGHKIDGRFEVFESRRSGSGLFTFDAINQNWTIVDHDERIRIKHVSSNTQLYPFDYILVVSESADDVVLSLPTDVAPGDTVRINYRYMDRGNTCKVKVKDGSSDKIAMTKDYIQFPEGKNLPRAGSQPYITEFDFTAGTDYLTTIELSYVENDGVGAWVLSQANPVVERVDATNRSRMGVAALATQEEVNLNHENNPNDNKIVTSKTLANKTSTETRRGISRIATADELQLPTTGAHLNDVIVTPKRLNERQATETIRGVAEVATQEEANTSNNDTHIVTPKKLNNRKATESLTGIAALVQSGGKASTARDAVGTYIYNNNEHTRIVTAKTLSERKATENSTGIGFLATESEVIAGANNVAQGPLFVTPVQLHKKTATAGRIGFTQTATQEEVDSGIDSFKYVTPETLEGRHATKIMTGISRFATQEDFNDGAHNVSCEPEVVKTFFKSTARMSVVDASGLNISGNFWDGTRLDVDVPTTAQRGTARTATQAEANKMTGMLDNVIITPTTLNGRKSTTAMDGIIRIATDAEAAQGDATNLAITPHTARAITGHDDWIATETRRGFVRVAPKTTAYAGDNLAGSTKPVDSYVHEGYAVSPRSLNFALANFLPKMATAQNSLRLGGAGTDSWMRRDINQTHLGSITVSKNLNVKKLSTFEDTVTANKTVLVKIPSTRAIELGTVGNDTSGVGIGFNSKGKGASTGNRWSLYAGGGTSTIMNPTQIGFNIVNDDGSNGAYVFKMNREGDTYTRRHSLIDTGNLYISTISSKLFVGGNSDNTVSVSATSAENRYGNVEKANRLYSNGVNSLVTTYKSGSSTASAVVLHTRNFTTHLNNTYVNVTGDTMTGRLTINETVHPKIPTSNGAYNTTKSGIGIMSVATELGVGGGFGATHGALLSINNEADRQFQLMGGNKGLYYRRGHSSYKVPGQPAGWSNWGKIYTTEHKPTPTEIGAVAGVDGVATRLNVKEYLQIGNCRIVVNNETKTVDFEWIE